MGEVSTPLKGDLRADGEREEPPQQGQQEESPATSAAESAEIRDASAASLGDSHGTAELYMTPVAAVPSSPSAPHPGREPPLREATEDPPSARPITMWPRPYPSPPASAGGGGCPLVGPEELSEMAESPVGVMDGSVTQSLEEHARQVAIKVSEELKGKECLYSAPEENTAVPPEESDLAAAYQRQKVGASISSFRGPSGELRVVAPHRSSLSPRLALPPSNRWRLPDCIAPWRGCTASFTPFV